MNIVFNFYIFIVRDFVFCWVYFIVVVDMIFNNFVNRVDIGNIVSCVYIFVQKLILNFLSEYSWICLFVVCDFIYDGICCYFGFVFIDNIWLNGVSFVEFV